MRIPPKLALGLLGVVAGAATLVLVFREEGEVLTAANLKEARERWQGAGVEDYDLQVVVTGAQKGEHEIRVRGGRVVAMTTGGAGVEQRIWDYWSVDGLFEFLKTELENAERPGASHGVADSGQIVLRAAFDGDLGYPRRFLRHVLGGGAGIEWEVLRFERR